MLLSKLMVVNYMTATTIMATLGQRMRQRREEMKLSRHKLAVATGVTEGTVTNWESDKHVPMLPPNQLAALLNALQWELKDMLTDDENLLRGKLEPNTQNP
jgi:transcriptional regulator with XRE-family HTH domain